MRKWLYGNLMIYLLFFSSYSYAQDIQEPKLEVPPLTTPPVSKIQDNKRVFNFIYENDVFNRRDDGYTNGVRLAWLSSEREINDETKRVINKYLPVANHGKKRVSYAIGQSMFTPKNLSDPNLIENDRPYAGWFYGSYGIISDTGKTLDNILLTLGVIGPLSMAEQTQKTVHHAIGSPNPEGWDNQLHNEPGIILTYERKWRNILQFAVSKFGFDITPDIGAALGNIQTNASMGMTLRIGYDLPIDYGPPRIRPSLPGSDFFLPAKNLGGYFFASAHGRAVARNIFLDGNSFESSHSVDKKLLVGEIQTGIAITFRDIRLSYTQIFLTREFYGQKKPQRFGSLSISYRF